MGFAGFRARMRAGETLVGTFVKVPSHDTVEVLARSALDFICLDAEHSPFDRRDLDACLAVARALDFPTLIRVPRATSDYILMALDAGAVGVVCPHIDTVEKARDIARWAHFGKGGRGYAGFTRGARSVGSAMPEILETAAAETVVIAQIEEPEGVDLAGEIAATEGIDGLFIGPADLTVAYGERALWSEKLMEAYGRVGAATKAAGIANVTFVPTAAKAAEMAALGVNMFFVGSEQGWMIQGANAAAGEIKGSS